MDNLKKEWEDKLRGKGLGEIKSALLVLKSRDIENIATTGPDDKQAPKAPPQTDKEAEDFARERVEKIFDSMQRMIAEKEKAKEDNRKTTIN